jgi:hypothetical protein
MNFATLSAGIPGDFSTFPSTSIRSSATVWQ